MSTLTSTSNCPVALGKSANCEDAVRLKRLEYTIQFCSLAILYYDYTLTLKDEITYIWKRKWRFSTVLYVFCRYALLANLIYLLAISEGFSGLNCSTGYMICGTLSVLGHIGIIGVWTLRTCVLYGNNRWMFAFFGTCGLAVVTMLTYRIPFMRCVGQKDLSILLGANAAVMLFIEIFSFLLATWHIWKTMKKDPNSEHETKRPLTRLHRVILSQGAYYIIGIFILAMAQLIFNFKWKTGFMARLINAIKLPFSGFLTARFMLRLRADGSKSYILDASKNGTGTGWDTMFEEFSGEMEFAAPASDDDPTAQEENPTRCERGHNMPRAEYSGPDRGTCVGSTSTSENVRSIRLWGTEQNV